jgi:hypothetical protein
MKIKIDTLVELKKNEIVTNNDGTEIKRIIYAIKDGYVFKCAFKTTCKKTYFLDVDVYPEKKLLEMVNIKELLSDSSNFFTVGKNVNEDCFDNFKELENVIIKMFENKS